MSTVPDKAHAKKRPPSSATRWLNCPASVLTSQLYENDDSAASEKGDFAHDLLETCVLFGIQPDSEFEDVNEAVLLTLEWIVQERAKLGPQCKVYAEQVFQIVETGEFGTGDITFVSPSVLHIADYKNGYVLVDHVLNDQMLTYLLGAIAKYGERDEYYITVIQPNASHLEGPIRTYPVTKADVARFRERIAYSIANEHEYVAGKHCKKTYCDHRGNCTTFLAWAEHNAADAWFPHDVNALTDEQLAAALDHAEVLHGLRDELRKAAMGRILQTDRKIAGYKVTKGRTNREYIPNAENAVKRTLREVFGYTDAQIHTQSFLSVKGVEDLIKQWSRKHGLGRGKWQEVWSNHLSDYVRENAGGLTLERATDARPAHKRGSEFGAISTPSQQSGKIVI
jgi:hypothetical protein